MRCSDIGQLIDLYMDDELAEEIRASVERHLLRCRECAFTVSTLEQTRNHLRGACAEHEAAPAFRERLAARLHDAFADTLKPAASEARNQRRLPF